MKYLWLLDDEKFIKHRNKKSYLKEYYPEILEDFYKNNYKEKMPFIQLFWHFLYNDLDLKLGVCKCGKRCSFKNLIRGYNHHCSNVCFWRDKEYIDKYKSKLSNIQKNKSKNEKQIIKEKRENTNKKKFGTLYYSQTKDWIKSVNKTCLKKYGNEFYQCCDKWKEQVMNTWLNKTEDEYIHHINKIKETTQKKYGVENYSQTQQCKDKMKKTCLEKYGVENYAQTSKFAKNHRKKIIYNDISFDSSWEVIVYQYCEKNNLSYEYQPEIRFKYYYNDKQHIYQPDFLIEGKLYEVKGDHFFEGDKMINPYDRTQDGLFESKHQCMLDNNVIILRREDIEKMREL